MTLQELVDRLMSSSAWQEGKANEVHVWVKTLAGNAECARPLAELLWFDTHDQRHYLDLIGE